MTTDEQVKGYLSAGQHHEKQHLSVLEELRRGPIYSVNWIEKNPGSRVAPAIDYLRNTLGYDIRGDGTSSRGAGPYILISEPDEPRVLYREGKDIYYNTRHWRRIRRLRLEFDGYKCCRCHDTEKLHVHHWKYDLFAEDIHDLMTLCEACHRIVHHQYPKNPGFPTHITQSMIAQMDRDEVGDEQWQREEYPTELF